MTRQPSCASGERRSTSVLLLATLLAEGEAAASEPEARADPGVAGLAPWASPTDRRRDYPVTRLILARCRRLATAQEPSWDPLAAVVHT